MTIMKNKKSKPPRFVLILSLLVLLVALCLFPFSRYVKNFGLEQLLFYIRVPLRGANDSTIWEVLRACVPIPAVITAGIAVLCAIPSSRKVLCGVTAFGHKFRFTVFSLLRLKKVLPFCTAGILAFALLWFNWETDFMNYMFSSDATTTIFEEYYVDPKTVDLQFPEEKRNLIYIYMESMESSYADLENGGLWKDNLIPNLTRIANDNIYFSDKACGGGRFFG